MLITGFIISWIITVLLLGYEIGDENIVFSNTFVLCAFTALIALIIAILGIVKGKNTGKRIVFSIIMLVVTFLSTSCDSIAFVASVDMKHPETTQINSDIVGEWSTNVYEKDANTLILNNNGTGRTYEGKYYRDVIYTVDGDKITIKDENGENETNYTYSIDILSTDKMLILTQSSGNARVYEYVPKKN